MNFRHKVSLAFIGIFLILILFLVITIFTSISVPRESTGKMQNMRVVLMHNL